MLDETAFGLFTLSAVALLGSPGPAIAALVAIGRTEGFTRGLRYFTGLQIGLASAAAVSAAGLFSLVQLVPGAVQVLAVAAAVYLVWLAWKIASAPIDQTARSNSVASSFAAGLFLGLSNPKAYIAFVSLFASRTIFAGSHGSDSLLKWLAVVVVMIIVDMTWLMIGAGLRHTRLSPAGERMLNVLLGATILVATVLAFR